MSSLSLNNKLIISIVLIVLSVIFGIIIHKGGKPYHNLYFTFHKLLSVGMIVFAALIFVGFFKQHQINSGNWVLIGLSILSAAALLVSGALMSLDKYHVPMLLVHRISTGLFLIGISGLFYTAFKIS